MIKFLATILSAIITVAVVYNYVPLKYFEIGQSENLGSTITTIQATDTLKNSRTTINDNFTNLNTDKLEAGNVNIFTARQYFGANATSTMFSSVLAWFGQTATSSFSSTGALTLATPLTAANGGTGSTTLSSNQVLLGNGTGILKTVSGWGTSGMFLTSGGAGAAPTWTSAAVDQAANYTWTGRHSFGASTSTPWDSASVTIEANGAVPWLVVGDTGTSTPILYGNAKGWLGLGTTTPYEVLSVNGTTTMTGLVIPTGASDGYVWASNSTGSGSWQAPKALGIWEFSAASTTQLAVTDDLNNNTVWGYDLAANSLGANGALNCNFGGSSNTADDGAIRFNFGGTNEATLSITSSNGSWFMNVKVANRNDTSAQVITGTGFEDNTFLSNFNQTGTINTTLAARVSLSFDKSADADAGTYRLEYAQCDVMQR